MDRLQTLKLFTRIVELGSFSAAARDAHQRQASVSRWISELEQELGQQLLERTTRACRVTPAGQNLYEHAKQLLLIWEEAQHQAHPQQAQGKLRISLPVVFGQRYISPHLHKLLTQHPQLELELLFTDRYVNLFEDGVDLALRIGQPHDAQLRTRILGRAQRWLVASPSFLAQHAEITTPEQLKMLPCLLHQGVNTSEVWRLIGPDQQTTTLHPQRRLSANHSETLCQLAIQGHGVALLADWLVAPAVASQQLVRLLPQHEAPAALIHAIYAAQRGPTPAVSAALDFFKACVEAIAP